MHYAATRAAAPTPKAVDQPPDEVAVAAVSLLHQDIGEPPALQALFDPVHVFRHSRPPTIKLRGCHYRGISRRSRVGACQFPGATLAGMAFKVNREPEPPLSFGDKDKFEIVNGGVLKIRRANRTNLYISPGMWASIEEAPSPSAGPSPRVQDDRDA